MGSNKNKALREIRKVAVKLPAYFMKTKIRVLGSDILQKNSNAKDSAGNQINPSAAYLIDAQVPVNHERRMKELYKTGGAVSVNKYIDEILEATKRAVETQRNIYSGISERKNALTFGI